MGESYWISGVQLGMLRSFSSESTNKLIDEIIDKQFIGNFETIEEQRKFLEIIKKLEEK